MQWSARLKKHVGSLIFMGISLYGWILIFLDHSGSEANCIIGVIYLLVLLAFMLIPTENIRESHVWFFFALGIIWLGYVGAGDMITGVITGFSSMEAETGSALFAVLANLILGFEISGELKNKKEYLSYHFLLHL